jgi:hypothetical protein
VFQFLYGHALELPGLLASTTAGQFDARGLLLGLRLGGDGSSSADTARKARPLQAAPRKAKESLTRGRALLRRSLGLMLAPCQGEKVLGAKGDEEIAQGPQPPGGVVVAASTGCRVVEIPNDRQCPVVPTTAALSPLSPPLHSCENVNQHRAPPGQGTRKSCPPIALLGRNRKYDETP